MPVTEAMSALIPKGFQSLFLGVTPKGRAFGRRFSLLQFGPSQRP